MIVLLPTIREVINEYGICADKRFGQNFIFDLNLTDKIARSAGKVSGVNVIEIGPGPGALTRSLLRAGAKVTAIEIDHKCYNALQSYLMPHSMGNLKLIQEDALDIKIYQKIYEELGGKYKIVANLPYNISTALLNLWLDNLEFFSGFTLMFQKEVAERLASAPHSKSYGRLSVKTQYLCEVEPQFTIPATAFFPPPKVTSMVVNLKPRDKLEPVTDMTCLYNLLQVVFGQRRKTLKSSMRKICDDPEKLLTLAAIDVNTRPEDLSVQQFCLLSNLLTDSNL